MRGTACAAVSDGARWRLSEAKKTKGAIATNDLCERLAGPGTPADGLQAVAEMVFWRTQVE